MSEPQPDRTVSLSEAARIAGVCRRTIYNWMNAGKLPFKRTVGGSRRVYESALWRQEVKVESPGNPPQ